MDSSTVGLRARIADLEAELDSLRARYDTLLEARDRAAERYKADYKKWRDFKRWLFRHVDADDHVKSSLNSGELDVHALASVLGKRKQELGPNGDRETKGQKQESVKVDFLPVAVVPKHQRRKSYHAGSSQNLLSLSPSTNKDRSLASQSTNLDDKLSLPVDDIEMPCKADLSRALPSTGPRKGRGRYAQIPSGTHTINSKFSIRKDRNDGVDFQYDAVVRNRQERKHMLGSDCECCREYYEAVGPLPPSRQPLWQTPTKCKALHNFRSSDDDKENTEGVEEHKQLISRHRHHWHRPKTPPGYWDIGFPDTQEVLDINRRAAEMHKRKLVEVEVEAKNNNGRYVECAPTIP